MKSQNSYPLVKLPSKAQVSLYLIKEELKSRKLFQALHEVGLDDCDLQPHLDSLIMQSMDMDDGTDETFVIYNNIMEKRGRKIKIGNESITKQALKAYHELLNVKEKLEGKNK